MAKEEITVSKWQIMEALWALRGTSDVFWGLQRMPPDKEGETHAWRAIGLQSHGFLYRVLHDPACAVDSLFLCLDGDFDAVSGGAFSKQTFLRGMLRSLFLLLPFLGKLKLFYKNEAVLKVTWRRPKQQWSGCGLTALYGWYFSECLLHIQKTSKFSKGNCRYENCLPGWHPA